MIRHFAALAATFAPTRDAESSPADVHESDGVLLKLPILCRVVSLMAAVGGPRALGAVLGRTADRN